MLLLCFLFYLWKLTAVGGIPPLVQLLETGSVKAKEAAAFVLRNLYCHSEDIRACVQSTEVVPALLHLLENTDIKVPKNCCRGP
jgi:HEAT repeat protein